MSSTSLLRRNDRRRREGDAAGSDAGLEQRPDSAIDAAATETERDTAAPHLLALQAMHDNLGNDFFASGPALDPTAALLQQHTMGSLALAMAGFEGAEQLTPGAAPLSVMRQLLRRSNAEDEGLDTQTADARIGSRAGSPLPEAVRARMERAFGHDFGHVRIHTDGGAAQAADALHAMAFAIGRDIYFGRGAWRPGTPAGDELLAHELTHVVQADEGRLPSVSGDGMDVSSPTDRHEREAVDTARSVSSLLGSGGADLSATHLDAPVLEGAEVAGPAVDAPALDASAGAAPASTAISAQSTGGDALAHREATTSSMTASGASSVRGESAEGDSYTTLTIAGKPVEVRVPPAEDRAAEVEVPLNSTPVSGLHLTRALLKLDENGKVVGGTVHGTLEVGGFFDGTQVSLGILPGGAVAPGVQGVPIQIGPVQGTIDLEITEAGVSGEGSLQASDLGLPGWLGIQGGGLDIAFANGQVLGQSRLQGTQTEQGRATAECKLTGTTLETKITYVVTPGLEPMRRVRIEQATLRGTMVRDLGDTNEADLAAPWSGSTEGGASATAPAPAPAAPTQQADNEHIIGGGLSATDDVFAVASGYQAPPKSRVGAGHRAAAPAPAPAPETTPEVDTSAGDTATDTGAAAALEAPAPRAPDAFLLTGTGRVVIADWVTGDLDLTYDPVGRNFDASGRLSARTEKTFGEVLSVASEVNLDIRQNRPVHAGAKMDFVSEQYKLKGTITGDYDIDAGKVDGDAVARTTHHIPFEGDYGRIRVLRHSKVEGRFRDNAFKDLRGKLSFDADLNAGGAEPLQLKGHVEGEYKHHEATVEGEATAFTRADFLLPMLDGAGGGAAQGEAGGGGGDTLTLLKDTKVLGTLTPAGLVDVTMDAALRYDRGGEAFLLGETQGATWDVNAGTLSGTGTFTLLKSIERPTRDGQWTLRLMEGSEVSATVAANQLTEIGGSLTVQVDDEKGPLANGILDNAKIDVATGEASGTLKLTTARKFHHPGEGQTLANGYGLVVLENSGISGTVTKDQLTDVGADLRTMITDEEGNLARMRLQGTLDLEKNEVDGKGTLSLARQIVVAENLANKGWEGRVLRGTKAEGHIKDNEFTKVTGALKSGVYDEEGEFLTITGEGEWTINDDLFDLVGTVTLTREKMLAEGGEGGWSIALVPGETTAQATIEDDVFQGISGTISTLVRRAGEDFAKLALEGTWNETEGFAGEGNAELLVDEEVAEIGDYNLLVTKGTGARVTLENEGITKLGGTVPMRLDKGDAAFIKGKLEGTYVLADKELSGAGSAEVLVEEELGRMGDDQLWLVKGSGATIKMDKNELTELGGQLNLSVRDGDGQYALVALQGTFDAKGGTGFTGTGGVTVTRNKQLYAVDAYSFWLKEGVGATAHIKENALEKIDGQVPFMVKDGGPGTLIEGNVSGTYDPKSGQITGTGAVYLGRTLEYDMGSGVVLKLLQGSGGDADVTESRLERLGGTLTAEIWKDGEGIVRVTAQGEYDVVHNSLTSLEGQATLLKPIEVANGDVRIQNVTGTATIQNNELIAAGGRGEIVVVPLNEMKGTFEVEWSNRGGVEQYEGRGWLDFTLIDYDPETGRGMSGLVYAEVKSGGEFEASGEIDYSINEMISGKLQVAVDDQLDPLIYGDLVVATNLVEARDLFSLERDIVPEQTIRLPYGLALFLGMKGGMRVGMDALRLNTRIAVGDWRPLSDDASVPRFEAGIHLGWGMNFNAMVAPYMGIGGDIGFASAQMGVRGEVSVDAPVEVRAGGMLRGGADGFYGELAVGAGISADMNLAIIPYIKGDVADMFSFEEDLDRFDQPLGELFHFEWGGKYIFGDTSRKEDGPIQRLDIPAATQRETAREERPSLGMTSNAPANNKKGGPQIESGSSVASQQDVGHGDMAEVMQTLNDVIAVIEGLGAAGELAGMIVSALAALATFGPAGLIVHVVWGIFKGDLRWDRIKTAVTKLVEAIRAAGRLLAKHMPGWWNSIQDVFSGEKPGLLDALFGADDRMREAVGRGDHLVAPLEMRVEMVNAMLKGWTREPDQECILRVLENSAQRGDLPALVSRVGAEWLLDDLDGYEDERCRELFRSAGIRF